MGLDTTIEERSITLALPPAVWEILDGTNKLALADGKPGLERWVADMILESVAKCLDIAIVLATSNCGSHHNQEGNA